MTEDTFIKLAAYAESQSNHPIAKSIVEAYGHFIDETVISSYEEVAGKGIKAMVNEQQILIGNATLMKESSLEVLLVNATGTIIHMAVDQVYVGYIVIADEIKETSKAAISKLKQQGVSQVLC